jgi:hypothetical protein
VEAAQLKAKKPGGMAPPGWMSCTGLPAADRIGTAMLTTILAVDEFPPI